MTCTCSFYTFFMKKKQKTEGILHVQICTVSVPIVKIENVVGRCSFGVVVRCLRVRPHGATPVARPREKQIIYRD